MNADEFTSRFGPTGEDYESVKGWAAAKGLVVKRTTPSRRIVDVSGTVASINSAFSVTMRRYQDPLTQRVFYAPDHEPTVDLEAQILAVGGIENSEVPATNLLRDKRKAYHSDTSGISNSNTGSGPGGNFLPSDIRAAYYGSGPLTGANQTVGIFSFDGYLASDLMLYFNETGMTSSVPITNVLVNGYDGGCYQATGTGTGPCDDAEQILDIVNVIGMAPGLASIRFYEGLSTIDILDQMATDVSLGLNVISSSWYRLGFDAPTVDPVFEQFQAQGQSYISAVGDFQAFNYDGASAYAPPEDDPYITQVGGTTLTTAGPGGAWVSEVVWDTPTINETGTGGGYVAGVSIPTYQEFSGVINSMNEGSTSYRNAPDIAAEADYDNPTVDNGVFYTGYAGTSFAAPRWAGLLALANEQASINGIPPVGFVNTSIYNIAGGTGYSAALHDVTSGNNGFPAVTGFDLATGWGSPIGPGLIAALTTYSPTTACPVEELDGIIDSNTKAPLAVGGGNAQLSAAYVAGRRGVAICSWAGFANFVTTKTMVLTFPATVTLRDSGSDGSYAYITISGLSSVQSIQAPYSGTYNLTIPIGTNLSGITIQGAAYSGPHAGDFGEVTVGYIAIQ